MKECRSEAGGLYATDGRLSLIIGIFCMGGNNLFRKVHSLSISRFGEHNIDEVGLFMHKTAQKNSIFNVKPTNILL